MGDLIQFPSSEHRAWAPIKRELIDQGAPESVIERMRLFHEFAERPSQLSIDVPPLPLARGADIEAVREALAASFTAAFHMFLYARNQAFFIERYDREMESADMG